MIPDCALLASKVTTPSAPQTLASRSESEVTRVGALRLFGDLIGLFAGAERLDVILRCLYKDI